MKRHSRYAIVAPALLWGAASAIVGVGVMAALATGSPAADRDGASTTQVVVVATPTPDTGGDKVAGEAAVNTSQEAAPPGDAAALAASTGDSEPIVDEVPVAADRAGDDTEPAAETAAAGSTKTPAGHSPSEDAALASPPAAAKAERAVEQLCELMTAAADQYGVPREFFIRLIWKESRFNPGAVSPVGAQGIAQFMPQTARIRGLKDPFDPVQALPASASFLADLEARFGSWGLAAAGYNGGPNRVPRFLAGTGGMPYETRDYVFSITGRSVEYYRNLANKAAAASSSDSPAQPAEAADPDAAVDAEDVAPTRAIEAVSDNVASGPAKPLADDLAGATVEPKPRVRPAYQHHITDCPRLVADLGRSRATPPPAGGRGGWTRWGAQVAGHTKRGVAMRQYARVKGRLPQDLVTQGPTVVVRRFAARGRRPIHAVQFAAPNRAAAVAICKRVAKARAPCVVVRNS